MGIEKGVNAFLDLFFPPRCPVCDRVQKKEEKICRNCKKELKWIKEPKCLKCGKPIEEIEQEYCGDCLREKFHYVRGYALWLYQGGARKSVAAFKYKGRQEYASFYGEEFMRVYGEQLRRHFFDVIVPVPVYREKKRIRGYNQAELFAWELAKGLGVPMESRALVRTRATRPQKGLSQKQRQENLKKAFRFCPEYNKKAKLGRVLLVDDIYTTGSTIEACTKVLLEAGAAQVYFAALCIGKDDRR